MNYEYLNYEAQPNPSATNIIYRVDPHMAERYIRAKAQQQMFKSVARSTRSAFNSIRSVLSDANRLQQKHGSHMYNGI